ncbi:MAG: L,D-transpeptidase [Alphaproteobacteria bacterium]|nr:L,D-transpeptidase [Alphaproteobacteria bacterium]
MSATTRFSRILPAMLAGLAALFLATGAQAQTMWGGGSEWGGGRQTVSFSKKYAPGQIIVSFGDRRLYKISSRGRAVSYPIAIPKNEARWQGVTSVSMKRKNPAWRPTPTMLRKNPRLPSWVPGGHPMNPLGVRALYLGSSAYRIHGTDAPWTIGKAASSGCIRMYNEDVIDLYRRTRVGARVTVTWKRFKSGGYTSANAKKTYTYNNW